MDDSENNHSRHESILKRLLGASKPQSQTELDDVIHEAGERNIIDEHTEDMLHGVFDISRLRLGDIMIPRKDIVAIDIDATVLDAVKIINESGHSRYPVISEDKDHVSGILMAKDLLPYSFGLKPDEGLKKLMRPPVIVPESKHVDTMLKEFQANRFHMAVVVDEFGGVCGLVTIEDILELIVGDINDEYDEPEDDKMIRQNQDGSYTVGGLMPLEEFEDFFGTELPKVDVDTVAGLVLHALGHFPKDGESVAIGRFNFKVLKAAERQIHLLQVTDKGTGEGEEDAR